MRNLICIKKHQLILRGAGRSMASWCTSKTTWPASLPPFMHMETCVRLYKETATGIAADHVKFQPRGHVNAHRNLKISPTPYLSHCLHLLCTFLCTHALRAPRTWCAWHAWCEIFGVLEIFLRDPMLSSSCTPNAIRPVRDIATHTVCVRESADAGARCMK